MGRYGLARRDTCTASSIWRRCGSLGSTCAAFRMAGVSRVWISMIPTRRSKLKASALVWEIENGSGAESAMDVFTAKPVDALGLVPRSRSGCLTASTCWYCRRRRSGPLRRRWIHPDRDRGGLHGHLSPLDAGGGAGKSHRPARDQHSDRLWRQGLPMGMQLIARPGEDARLLQLAQAWHQMTQWPQRYPGLPGLRRKQGGDSRWTHARTHQWRAELASGAVQRF